MTSWLSNITTAGGGFVRNFLSSEQPPNRVLQVKPGNYSDKIIHCREDALVLYQCGDSHSRLDSFEIVLHRPCTETLEQSFSLFRAKNQQDGEVKFLEFKDKVPILVSIAKELCNLQSLQKLCDAISQNPSFTVAHLAVIFQLYGHFQNNAILRVLDTPDLATGMTPLQLAVKEGSLRTVQVILAASPSLDSLDNEGNSVFHFAATSSKEVISALSAASIKCLNHRNLKGHTPLHMACLADKPECVKAMLLAGADVNISAVQDSLGAPPSPPWFIKQGLQAHLNKLYVQDMKCGGTPLHWSCSREVVNALSLPWAVT